MTPGSISLLPDSERNSILLAAGRSNQGKLAEAGEPPADSGRKNLNIRGVGQGIQTEGVSRSKAPEKVGQHHVCPQS